METIHIPLPQAVQIVLFSAFCWWFI